MQLPWLAPAPQCRAGAGVLRRNGEAWALAGDLRHCEGYGRIMRRSGGANDASTSASWPVDASDSTPHCCYAPNFFGAPGYFYMWVGP